LRSAAELNDGFEDFHRAAGAIQTKAGSDAAPGIGLEKLALDGEKCSVFASAVMFTAWPLACPRNGFWFHGRPLSAIKP
jgi:hypothetical protein